MKEICNGFLRFTFFFFQFIQILGSYESSIIPPDPNYVIQKLLLEPSKDLYIFLWYIANTITFRQLSNLFGLSTSTIRNAISRVALWFISKRHDYIKWPEVEEMCNQSKKFEELGGAPGIIGIIDGTHMKIKAPKTNKRNYFNRKKYYSIQMQAIANADMMFIDIHCGEPGSLHENQVLRRSKIYKNTIKNEKLVFPNNTFIIGDSAYRAKEWLVTPFKDNGNLSSQEIRFNSMHSLARIVVENTFKLLKKRFRRFQYFTEGNLSFINKLVVSSCILHNLCIKEGDFFEFDE